FSPGSLWHHLVKVGQARRAQIQQGLSAEDFPEVGSDDANVILEKNEKRSRGYLTETHQLIAQSPAAQPLLRERRFQILPEHQARFHEELAK
ncbi:MAG: hypothetical protein L0170_04795, partial [Acidobacteria bacterium]|nr:hypothetical protein [Acidobacteriota bacterium]